MKQPLKETYERMFGTLNEAKEEKVYMRTKEQEYINNMNEDIII